MIGRVISVNVGPARAADWAGRLRRTAIDKRPVADPVTVAALGLTGDEQADRANHGGVHQAVYAYAREDLDRWAARLGRELRDGEFGENLTTAGVEVTGAVIGERWQVGSAVLEVSCPRIPCSVFQRWLGEPAWVRRFTAEGRPGAYLRVITEGRLRAGDAVTVGERPAHGVTIQETFLALTTRAELLPRLMSAPQLPPEAHERARRHLWTTPAT